MKDKKMEYPNVIYINAYPINSYGLEERAKTSRPTDRPKKPYVPKISADALATALETCMNALTNTEDWQMGMKQQSEAYDAGRAALREYDSACTANPAGIHDGR